jgi:hypothetical protein
MWPTFSPVRVVQENRFSGNPDFGQNGRKKHTQCSSRAPSAEHASVARAALPVVAATQEAKNNRIYLYRINLIGGFHGASEIFLTPRKNL